MTQTKPAWPLQSQCRVFYGNPTTTIRGAAAASLEWERQNLVSVPLPWAAQASWDAGTRIKSVRVHNRCADSLTRVLAAIWANAKHINPANPQAEIERVGLHKVGGGYNWRLMRGGNALSMHSYGCALDLDPERNGLGDTTPNFGRPENRYVVDAFIAEGWVWGGGWKRPDGMHFQAARVD